MNRLIKSCNSSLSNIDDESLIPKDCYFQMKFKEVKNEETLKQNKIQMKSLGRYLHNYTYSRARLGTSAFIF